MKLTLPVLKGTQEAYEAIVSKDSGKIYITSDKGNIYLGNIKLGGTELGKVVKDIAFVEDTQVFTITYSDKSTKNIDFALESIIQDFEYNGETKTLTLTLENGSTTSISLADLIDIYIGGETGTTNVDINAGEIFVDVKLSGSTDNTLIVKEDGLFVPPVRNFIEYPINLENEVTGVLPATKVRFKDGDTFQEKSDKGDLDGFSPEISIAQYTEDLYQLKITNKSGSFITPNLRGSGSGESSSGGNGSINPFNLSVDVDGNLWIETLTIPPILLYDEKLGNLYMQIGAWDTYQFEFDEESGNLYFTPFALHKNIVGVDTGVIVAWSGLITDIPKGYVFCDGNNGTPDLRERFIVGAGLDYKVNDTGGENQVKLTVAQMPSHNHGGGAYHAGNTSPPSGILAYAGPTSTSHTGGNEAHENRPPYYALAYIMKL